MSGGFSFEFPLGWQVGGPAAVLALAWWVAAMRRRGLGWPRVAWLGALRGAGLAILVLLAARPVHVAPEPPDPREGRRVWVLLDRSESMSLVEDGESRFDAARAFALRRLFPAMAESGLAGSLMLFDSAAAPADAEILAAAAPNGKRTDLAGAILGAAAADPSPPLAVIALTDGVVTESRDNARALSALADARAPFIGLGFGSDAGADTLSLRSVEAPSVVPADTSFRISALLEMTGGAEIPVFDLVLLRDDLIIDRKTVTAGRGPRTWQESFDIAEPENGVFDYTIRMMTPDVGALRTVSTAGNAQVRVADERELRILYVQGSLTWDYKFVSLALREDPSIKLTGLTRTSESSYFRQNVEGADELTEGFPSSVESMAPYRVIVLSNLKPSDLSGSQQEALGRFCSELGGGILMIGGEDTFDGSWRGSRLEGMLPVTFAGVRGVAGLDRPFRVMPTESALESPVFRIDESGVPMREVWARLPTFTGYGRVDSLKPGARIWLEHPDDQGPEGKRILMATQRYGAGQACVITVQNFWRWRLAQDADPAQFDRFWRQLFRFLSESGRQEIAINLADQQLRPGADIRVTLERQPNPANAGNAGPLPVLAAKVTTDEGTLVHEQSLSLEPDRPVSLAFRAETAGAYRVSVENEGGQSLASRRIDIQELNIEFERTGRHLETLHQWAALTGGTALPVEDCVDARALVDGVRTRVETMHRSDPERTPLGINPWILMLVLALFGADWILRKRWISPGLAPNSAATVPS